MRYEVDILSATASHLWPELDPNDFELVMVYDRNGYGVILTTGKRGETRILAQANLGLPEAPLDNLMRLLARQAHFGPGGNPSFHWYSKFRPGTDKIAKSKASETQDKPPSYSSIEESGESKAGGSSNARDVPHDG